MTVEETYKKGSAVFTKEQIKKVFELLLIENDKGNVKVEMKKRAFNDSMEESTLVITQTF